MIKTGDFFSSNFRDMGKAMPVVFGERKMPFWVRKKASYDFREGNSGSQIRLKYFVP